VIKGTKRTKKEDEISTPDCSVKAVARGLKARSRIALPKITGTEELTAGQLPSRKSLGSSLPRDPAVLLRKFFRY